MPVATWTTPADLDTFLAAQRPGFIFKHSTRCPISSEANRQITLLGGAEPDIPVYRVLVIENRAASDAVTEKLGIPHASPQAILVKDGAAAWSASHHDITAEALRERWHAP
jgi:bacillithiol system protein YtxJ